VRRISSLACGRLGFSAGIVWALAAPGLLAACGSEDGASDAWTAGDYPPDAHAQSYLPVSGLAGQNGAVRGYKVHVPKRYDASTPTPVVFAFHGLGQDAVMFAQDGAHLFEQAEREGYILVTPTGTLQNPDGSWGAFGSWNAGECCGSAATNGVDDVALVRAIAAEVERHLNVDRGRVYATGLSNGAFLSYRLACEAADLFVAVAPAAGAIGTHAIAPMGVGNADFTRCAPSAPVAVLASHGTADPLVPYAYMAPSLVRMAEANGCSASSVPATMPSSAGDSTCVTYSGCAGGVEVTGCSIEGGGHCWFGDATCGTGASVGSLIVGKNSDSFSNTEAAWAFLKRFERR